MAARTSVWRKRCCCPRSPRTEIPITGWLAALCDHVAIRQRVDALVSESPALPAVLHDLGSRLAEHVRLEERELFPLIERTMPAARLAAVAVALEQAAAGKPGE